jgi:hypothetical protein
MATRNKTQGLTTAQFEGEVTKAFKKISPIQDSFERVLLKAQKELESAGLNFTLREFFYTTIRLLSRKALLMHDYIFEERGRIVIKLYD